MNNEILQDCPKWKLNFGKFSNLLKYQIYFRIYIERGNGKFVWQRSRCSCHRFYKLPPKTFLFLRDGIRLKH